jgi:predicted DCC family thiol-disulfide oxidoreductase YuxK
MPRLTHYISLMNMHEAPMEDQPAKGVTVWFDGACPLCTREIALKRRLDRRGAIRFVDVAQPDATCPIDRRALLARFHAREDGVMLSGAAAFAAMWRAIPLLRPLGLLARNSAALKGLEWLYLKFLVIRPRLQKLAAGR